MAAGAGMLGAGGVAGGCNEPGDDRGAPTGPAPTVSRDVGVVLSHEQFRTDRLVAQAQAAKRAGFRYVWAPIAAIEFYGASVLPKLH